MGFNSAFKGLNIPWATNTRKNISMQTVKESRWQCVPRERTRAVSLTNWRAVFFVLAKLKRFILCLMWFLSSRIFVTGWVTHNKLVPQCCYTRRFFSRTFFFPRMNRWMETYRKSARCQNVNWTTLEVHTSSHLTFRFLAVRLKTL